MSWAVESSIYLVSSLLIGYGGIRLVMRTRRGRDQQ